MLDRGLATLYETETKRLKEAVNRNIKRFPKGFMFQLTKEEFEDLRSQIETLEKSGRPLRPQFAASKGGTRYLPYAFTLYRTGRGNAKRHTEQRAGHQYEHCHNESPFSAGLQASGKLLLKPDYQVTNTYRPGSLRKSRQAQGRKRTKPIAATLQTGSFNSTKFYF